MVTGSVRSRRKVWKCLWIVGKLSRLSFWEDSASCIIKQNPMKSDARRATKNTLHVIYEGLSSSLYFMENILILSFQATYFLFPSYVYAFEWTWFSFLLFFQVLVVANPANTNALILKEFAPSIPEKNITCLTRLDHNRALGQISERLNVQVSDVKNVVIWGNHSSTQYPDVNHATVKTPAGEKSVRELVKDDEWYCKRLIVTF